MSESGVIVSLTYLKNEDRLHIEFGGTSLGELTLDFSKITGGEARALLAAAAAECMGSWLLYFLKRHIEKLGSFKMSASAHTSLTDKGNIVDKVIVELEIEVAGDESDREKYEKTIKRILQKGCLISRSLENGIIVEYIPIIKR